MYIYMNLLFVGAPPQPRISRADAKQKEMWKKTVDVVTLCVSDENPSDEELAFYLGLHDDYQVEIL